MFNVGDVLKARMDVAEDQYEGCRGTTVYNKMMELAKTKRFKIMGVTQTHYVVRHLGTDPLVERPEDKNEVHTLFELDNEYDDTSEES